MWMSWNDITEIVLSRGIRGGKNALIHQAVINECENYWNIPKELKIQVGCIELCTFLLLQVTLSFYGVIFHPFMLLWLIQHIEDCILIPKIFWYLKYFNV